jgi:uncharacterized membrane protein
MSQTPPVESAPAPYVPPPSEAPRKTIRDLRPRDPFQWLAAGWSDMRAHPGISAFYGASFCVMALVLGAVFQAKPEYTMSIASGCLLLGPFLAMGLYEVSQRRERGEMPRLASSLICWKAHVRSMSVMLVLVLIVHGTAVGQGVAGRVCRVLQHGHAIHRRCHASGLQP